MPKFYPRALALLACCAFPAMAIAQSGASLLIWPLNPTIKASESATALWLENAGSQPLTLQVRSFAWAQPDGEDAYAPQQDVIATPPVVTLPPKGKQLIRITRLAPPPRQAEQAYRLIVDEVPVERTPQESQEIVTGVQFRLRYSLPLFTYGAGMLPTAEAVSATAANKEKYPAPHLVWTVTKDGKQRIIEIENRGNGHARLTQSSLATALGDVELTGGLMGYVLAGSRLRYPLPDDSLSGGNALRLTASINNAPPAAVMPNFKPVLNQAAQ